MKNKLKYFSFIMAACLMTAGVLHAQSKNSFDDLFKDFNFDQFLSEMEKEIDKEGEAKEFAAPSKATDTQPKSSIVQTELSSGKTKEELFLHPTMQTTQEKGKQAHTSLTPKSRKAFNEVMKELITLLHTFEAKVMGMRQFSLPFKEEFSQYIDAFDKINIAYGIIVSKKLYSTIIPYQATPQNQKDAKDPAAKAQPAKQPQGAAELMTLRQEILDIIKELKKLDAHIKYDPSKEEKEDDTHKLKELQKKHHKVIDFSDKPLTPKKKRHGSAVPKPTAKKNKTHEKSKLTLPDPDNPQDEEAPLWK